MAELEQGARTGAGWQTWSRCHNWSRVADSEYGSRIGADGETVTNERILDKFVKREEACITMIGIRINKQQLPERLYLTKNYRKTVFLQTTCCQSNSPTQTYIPSLPSKVEAFDALLCDVFVRQVSYAVLCELIWGFVHVVEDMRELKPAAALGLLQRIAGTLGPSPSTIDKTTYGYWRARLQGRNRKATLNDQMKKVALPFLNWWIQVRYHSWVKEIFAGPALQGQEVVCTGLSVCVHLGRKVNSSLFFYIEAKS